MQLFVCEPYAAKLTRGTCVRRWELANLDKATKPRAGNKAIKQAHRDVVYAECSGCTVGEGRRDTE